ncbi:MAG: hypothetical protein ABJZ55_22285 [Fuerstiella sp.]
MTHPVFQDSVLTITRSVLRKITNEIPLFVMLVTIPLFVVGCSNSETETVSEDEAPPVMEAQTSDEPTPLTVRELRKLLKVNELAKFQKVGNDIVAAELYQSGVKDISPLSGIPLRQLDLGFTEVTDISALKGMPLTYLNLEETKVDDLSALKGMPLEELHLHSCPLTSLELLDGMPLQRLNLSKVPVTSIAACANMPLETLWIPNTKVTDLSALAGKTMQSLDIEGTDVADLSALAGMKTLQRLNIVGTKVTDLSALAGLPLTRISLTPENITEGIEVLRDMPSLNNILTTTVGASTQSAAQFWSKYDAGVYNEQPEPTADEPAGDELKAEADVDESAADETSQDAADSESPKVDKQSDESEPSKG